MPRLPPIFLVLATAVLLSCGCMAPASVHAFNITEVLDQYPDYGLFNEWLSITKVAREINGRTGVTVLATSNTSFQSYLSGIHNASYEPGLGIVMDTLRYQVLLTYYGIPELQKINLNNYTEVTTLLQTTGRTNDSAGFVDIYHVNDTSSATGGTKLLVGHYTPDKSGNATIVGNVAQSPYSYSVLHLSAVLAPLPTTAPSPLPSPTMAPAPSSGASPPAPPTPPATPGPLGSTSAGDSKDNYATVTTVSVPLTVTVMFLASVAVLLL